MEEVPLQSSLNAHASRCEKKKGHKGKAIMCGIGAAHQPRSDGVPVTVATVSLSDVELLKRLSDAKDAAFCGSPSQLRRTYSI